MFLNSAILQCFPKHNNFSYSLEPKERILYSLTQKEKKYSQIIFLYKFAEKIFSNSVHLSFLRKITLFDCILHFYKDGKLSLWEHVSKMLFQKRIRYHTMHMTCIEKFRICCGSLFLESEIGSLLTLTGTAHSSPTAELANFNSKFTNDIKNIKKNLLYWELRTTGF